MLESVPDAARAVVTANRELTGTMGKAYIKHYIQPAFLICAMILAVAGGGMSVAIKSLGLYLKKEPCPLKKSLDLLDEKGLGSYKVASKEKIASQDVIDSLGTKDYIQWVLQDLDAPADSPVRYCSLFITYYELPDKVPHVPEECYMGSGFQNLASDSVTIGVDSQKIPARCLVFTNTASDYWQRSTKFPILYFFRVNQDYVNSREDVRFALNKNIRSKYSYFCKVEWKFFDTKLGVDGHRQSIYPDKEQAIAASRKLLSMILPVLEKEHWPF
jgi:hypothetical protein